MKGNEMQIVTMKLADIKPAEYNPRSISDANMAGLKHSVGKFGQVANLIVNKDGTLISGHQRMRAMTELGWTEAKVYQVDLDKAEEKRLNLMMNSYAIQGTFDELKLSEMIEELKNHEDYEALQLKEIEPLDVSDYVFEDTEEGESGNTTTNAGDLFIKKIVIGLTDYGLAKLLKKLDEIGEDPSELYERLVGEKFHEELSGE